jgi:hypothetical protein
MCSKFKDHQGSEFEKSTVILMVLICPALFVKDWDLGLLRITLAPGQDRCNLFKKGLIELMDR